MNAKTFLKHAEKKGFSGFAKIFEYLRSIFPYSVDELENKSFVEKGIERQKKSTLKLVPKNSKFKDKQKMRKNLNSVEFEFDDFFKNTVSMVDTLNYMIYPTKTKKLEDEMGYLPFGTANKTMFYINYNQNKYDIILPFSFTIFYDNAEKFIREIVDNEKERAKDNRELLEIVSTRLSQCGYHRFLADGIINILPEYILNVFARLSNDENIPKKKEKKIFVCKKIDRDTGKVDTKKDEDIIDKKKEIDKERAKIFSEITDLEDEIYDLEDKIIYESDDKEKQKLRDKLSDVKKQHKKLTVKFNELQKQKDALKPKKVEEVKPKKVKKADKTDIKKVDDKTDIKKLDKRRYDILNKMISQEAKIKGLKKLIKDEQNKKKDKAEKQKQIKLYEAEIALMKKKYKELHDELNEIEKLKEDLKYEGLTKKEKEKKIKEKEQKQKAYEREQELAKKQKQELEEKEAKKLAEQEAEKKAKKEAEERAKQEDKIVKLIMDNFSDKEFKKILKENDIPESKKKIKEDLNKYVKKIANIYVKHYNELINDLEDMEDNIERFMNEIKEAKENIKELESDKNDLQKYIKSLVKTLNVFRQFLGLEEVKHD